MEPVATVFDAFEDADYADVLFSSGLTHNQRVDIFFHS